MTQTRNPHPSAQPTLTGGQERPATPCLGRWWLFDSLIDHAESKSRPTFRDALVREARDVCSACPISKQCLTVDNADEKWAALIVGRPAKRTPKAGHPAAQTYTERLPMLVELAEKNAPVVEAAEVLGVTTHGLYKWCVKWNHRDLWAKLRQPTEVAA